MATYTIVGGGICGLVSARVLSGRGRDVLGLERGARLGSGIESEFFRFYSHDSVEFLRGYLGMDPWECVPEEASERYKGKWRRPEGEYLNEEQPLLRGQFYRPQTNSAEVLDRLMAAVAPKFQVRKNVVEIRPEDRVVVCQDDTEFSYEKLVWCASAEALSKAWDGEFTPVLRSLETNDEPAGLLCLTQELTSQIFPAGTLVFPFRFKDARLKAIGSAEPLGNGEVEMRWRVYLGEEISNDREEIAKCVRTLKRELLKDFDDLKPVLKTERIAYGPVRSAAIKREPSSVEVLPDVFYVGSELRLKETPEDSFGLDRIVWNCRNLEELATNDETRA